MERKSIAYSVAAGVELVHYNSKHGAVWTVEHCGQVLFSSVDKALAIKTFCSAIDYYLGFSKDFEEFADEDFEEFIEEDFENKEEE